MVNYKNIMLNYGPLKRYVIVVCITNHRYAPRDKYYIFITRSSYDGRNQFVLTRVKRFVNATTASDEITDEISRTRRQEGRLGVFSWRVPPKRHNKSVRCVRFLVKN